MEAKKSPSGRTRNAGGAFQDEFKVLRTRRLMSKVGEFGCPSSSKWEQICLPSLHVFILFWPSVYWMPFTLLMRTIFFIQLTNPNADPFQRHLPYTCRNASYQLSGHFSPVRWTHEIITVGKCVFLKMYIYCVLYVLGTS